MKKPKILLIPDVPEWAQDKRADNIIKYASHKYEFTKIYDEQICKIDYDEWDLIMVFPWNSCNRLPKPIKREKLIAGLNSYRTWQDIGKKEVVSILNDHYGAIAPICKDLFNEFDGWIDNIFYTPNGVDTGVYHDSSRRNLRRDRLVFGWLGKEGKDSGKNCDSVLIPAFNEVKSVDFRPIIVGRDGRKPLVGSKIIEYYNSIHFIVCASTTEGGSNTILEGISCGCSLLSTMTGNVIEFGAPGYNYVYTDPTIESFVKSIKWINENRDVLDSMRDSITHKIRSLWSWDVNILNYINMFDKILEKNRSL